MLVRKPPNGAAQKLVQKARDQQKKIVEKAKSGRRRLTESYERQLSRFKSFSQRNIDHLRHTQGDLTDMATAIMKDYSKTLKKFNKAQLLEKAKKMAAMAPLAKTPPTTGPDSSQNASSPSLQALADSNTSLISPTTTKVQQSPKWKLPNKVFKEAQAEISLKLSSKWRTLQKLLPIAGSSIGNKVEIYHDGSEVPYTLILGCCKQENSPPPPPKKKPPTHKGLSRNVERNTER